jgi:hypothetical protein
MTLLEIILEKGHIDIDVSRSFAMLVLHGNGICIGYCVSMRVVVVYLMSI